MLSGLTTCPQGHETWSRPFASNEAECSRPGERAKTLPKAQRTYASQQHGLNHRSPAGNWTLTNDMYEVSGFRAWNTDEEIVWFDITVDQRFFVNGLDTRNLSSEQWLSSLCVRKQHNN